jgi:thiol-disulfide isomerase/thioredoxin
MMKYCLYFSILFFICALSIAQNTITGTFSKLSNQQVTLSGFSEFNTYVIDSVSVNDKGEFTLSYSNNDFGMGILTAADNKPYIVVLGDETISLQGESFGETQSITITEGQENKLFAQYASEQPRRDQCLSAWDYLARMYQQDSLFADQNIPKQAIATETNRIKAEDRQFLAALPSNSYLSYYLPLRNRISSVATIAQYRTNEIPATIEAFRSIDYTDARLYKSGLLANVIESHFWLIENSGRSLDSVYIEMNASIDRMLESLVANEQTLNAITAHLFKFLEQRSLFPASEYLAIQLLNQKSCTLTNDFALQLESYRAMKKGNTAPDIDFSGGDMCAPGYPADNTPLRLSAIKSHYKVVVFGANWCPQCPVELQHMAHNYARWKIHGVEVVFVSLAEDPALFKNFTNPFPFISICDYKKWESPIINDWHVFATPTIYLLNDKLEIILKPNSVNQLASWIDWYLIKGNTMPKKPNIL